MSAIWGAIDLSGDAIDDKTKDLMRSAFDVCVIDRYEHKNSGNVYMGCGIQYFTDRAANEKLPIYSDQYFLTADVILDNPDELCSKLGVPQEDRKNIADGDILFDIYKKYGIKCLNDLLGAYAFVWYDRNENAVEMVLDAVGNRCLYYMKDGSIVYFSSLIEPLKKLKTGCRLNDRWIADFLSMDHLFMINEAEETPVEGIYRIAPAQYVKIDVNKVHKKTYWNPQEDKYDFKASTDDEYKQIFRKVWKDAVEDVVSSSADDISILLSGGLDSTAVAAVAAPYLKKKGRKLYSYTSVPDKKFNSDNSGYYVQDETEDVKKSAAFFGNVETRFIDLDGKNAYELMDKEMKILEMPYKSIQNCLWMCDALNKAYKSGSRIMLTGGYGNTTISYTDLNVYMNTLYTNNKIKLLKHELKAFAQNMEFDYKYAFASVKKECATDYEAPLFRYGQSFVNRSFADKVKSNEREEKMMRDLYYSRRDYKDYYKLMFNILSLRQTGEISTKHSLATGVIIRDPTKDKRIIKLCMSFPMEQFCKNGIDRRLVKVYLKDIMPQHVIRFNKQGQQSADLKYRFEKNWDVIRNEWIHEFQRDSQSKYVNTKLAQRRLTESADIDGYSNFALTRYMYTLLVLRYENEFYGRRDDMQYDSGVKQCNDNKEKRTEQPLVSVVIQVDKHDEKLKQCIESVCAQTYNNLEIILINNESHIDNILHEYTQKDKRIHVISNYNCNAVLDTEYIVSNTKGQYISFLAPDNRLNINIYEKLVCIAQEQNADVSICGYSYTADMTEEKNNIYVFDGKSLIAGYISDEIKTDIPDETACYLFNRKYLAGVDKTAYSIGRWINTVMLKDIKTALYISTAYCCGNTCKNKDENYIKDYIKLCNSKEYVFKACTNENYACRFYDWYLEELIKLCSMTAGITKKNQDIILKEIKRTAGVILDNKNNSSEPGEKRHLRNIVLKYNPSIYFKIKR